MRTLLALVFFATAQEDTVIKKILYCKKPWQLDLKESKGAGGLSSAERRRFLALGLKVTGVFLGGSILSLTSTGKARGGVHGVSVVGTFPYKPHYSMVIFQDRCIDCELCVDACTVTNKVPVYGYRLNVLEKENVDQGSEFMPVLCNQCNKPPCVKVCPTKATFKDKQNGIVMINDTLCIGCKACMTSCPYNARYFNKETKSVDKCDFCFQARLSIGKMGTACSEACPADVLVFGDLTDPESRAYQLVHEPGRTLWVLRPERGSKPNVFYLRD